MEYKFTPSVCKEQPAEGDKPAQPATFSGSVTLRAPTFDEACDMSEKMVLALADVEEKIRETRRVRELPKISGGFVVALDLKRLKDGKEFKSWADLLENGAAHWRTIHEIATAAMGGPDGGNV